MGLSLNEAKVAYAIPWKASNPDLHSWGLTSGNTEWANTKQGKVLAAMGG